MLLLYVNNITGRPLCCRRTKRSPKPPCKDSFFSFTCLLALFIYKWVKITPICVMKSFYSNIQNSEIVGMLALDIREPFDTVNNKITLEKLQHYGISGIL